MMENKTPTRQKLNRVQRAERRKAAIREIKKGKSQSEVARQLGVTRGNVHYWWKEYKEKVGAVREPPLQLSSRIAPAVVPSVLMPARKDNSRR